MGSCKGSSPDQGRLGTMLNIAYLFKNIYENLKSFHGGHFALKDAVMGEFNSDERL